MSRIIWQWHTYQQLTTDMLYAILRLRQVVFSVEQSCAYLDLDGRDRYSLHLTGHDARGELVAYLRIVEPGKRYSEPSIGRVATSQNVRRSGVGKMLMAEGLRKATEVYPGQPNRISAQQYLERFYNRFGYERVGEVYDEDGIPHVEMLRT
jgi:ElaA protein